MTTDLTLVARREPSTEDLRNALDHARATSELGAYEVVGDWSSESLPLIEVSADVSDGELLLQVFRPSVSLEDAARPYTLAIGLEPPTGEDGHPRLTQMAMSAMATDDQVAAVLAVVRDLAIRCEGYLVVNGEHVRLDGVADPVVVAVAAPPPAAPPPSRAFVSAFFDTGQLTGEQGWKTSMNLLRTALHGHHDEPDLRPRYIQRDGEWRRFLPGDPAPDWWPDTQYLLTPQPHVRWELDPTYGPADTLTELSAKGDLDPDVTASFVPTLVDLAREQPLAYGLVHVWGDREPLGPDGLKIGNNGPRMFLVARTVTARYLPDLYWAQVFGPAWVEMFGADTLSSTPAARVEEVSPGRWLVQLTDDLTDVIDDHDRFQAARNAAKAHLGSDAFYDEARGPHASYRVPRVATLAERGPGEGS